MVRFPNAWREIWESKRSKSHVWFRFNSSPFSCISTNPNSRTRIAVALIISLPPTSVPIVLSNIVYTHTRVTHRYKKNTHTCHRTIKHFTRVSHTCEHINTTPASHVRTRMCGTRHHTHASRAMRATTLLSLTHLHHAPSRVWAEAVTAHVDSPH